MITLLYEQLTLKQSRVSLCYNKYSHRKKLKISGGEILCGYQKGFPPMVHNFCVDVPNFLCNSEEGKFSSLKLDS